MDKEHSWISGKPEHVALMRLLIQIRSNSIRVNKPCIMLGHTYHRASCVVIQAVFNTQCGYDLLAVTGQMRNRRNWMCCCGSRSWQGLIRHLLANGEHELWEVEDQDPGVHSQRSNKTLQSQNSREDKACKCPGAQGLRQREEWQQKDGHYGTCFQVYAGQKPLYHEKTTDLHTMAGAHSEELICTWRLREGKNLMKQSLSELLRIFFYWISKFVQNFASKVVAKCL